MPVAAAVAVVAAAVSVSVVVSVTGVAVDRVCWVSGTTSARRALAAQADRLDLLGLTTCLFARATEETLAPESDSDSTAN